MKSCAMVVMLLWLTRAKRSVINKQLDLPDVTRLCCHGDIRVPFTVFIETKESFCNAVQVFLIENSRSGANNPDSMSVISESPACCMASSVSGCVCI